MYEALHLVAAEEWGADLFLTFNVEDFKRLGTEEGPRIVVPPGIDQALSETGEE